MEYALDRFAQEVRAALIAGGIPETEIDLVTPKPNIPADLAFPTFKAARARGVPPPQLAQELAATFAPGSDSLIGAAAAAGPFLNVALHPARFTAAVLAEVARRGAQYGHDDLGAGQDVVVDYSAPNVAKRMHVGHIRSTIIGQSIVNLLRALGYTVHGDNHIGDWGKQFGIVIAAIKRYGMPDGDGEALLEGLETIYTRYNGEMKSDASLDDLARNWSLRLEQGDAEARAIWQQAVDLTLTVNERLYQRLGVKIDHNYGESFYEPMLAGVIQRALDKGVAHRDDAGAVVVDELEAGIPSFLLQRTDGGTLYMTRDVATIEFRLREFHPSKLVYVIGIPQELHLRQLFALLRAMGEVDGVELVHVKFGTVFDQAGKKLSTREGNMVYLEALLNEAHSRARAILDQTGGEFSDAEKDQIAEQVGIGAVVYNDLYQDTRRDITLDWDRMLALEGNSAPYIQYMHARCRSILRRAEAEGQDETSLAPETLLTHPAELAVVKQIARLPAAVRDAAERYAPFVIADWCYEQARTLSAFYRDCPVLKAETPALRAARLQLVAATAQALHNGLGLLGIQAPERM